MSEGGCGTDIAQGVPSNLWTAGTGENAIIGTRCSVATPTMAEVAGVPAVPSRISTLSSSISLRAFLVAVEGSDPSSNRIIRIFSPPTSLANAYPALTPRPEGIPIHEPGPVGEATPPTTIAAGAGAIATATAAPPMNLVHCLRMPVFLFPLALGSRAPRCDADTRGARQG